MGRQEVLMFGEIRLAKKSLEEIKERYEFKEFNSTKNEFLLEATTKYENVVAILLAHGADQIIDTFDTEMLDALSPAVNVILVIGKASELVDVKAATGNGVFVADTTTNPQLTEEEVEIATLENLEFALITGVPKDPVNEIQKVAEFASNKAEEMKDLDFSDIPISL